MNKAKCKALFLPFILSVYNIYGKTELKTNVECKILKRACTREPLKVLPDIKTIIGSSNQKKNVNFYPQKREPEALINTLTRKLTKQFGDFKTEPAALSRRGLATLTQCAARARPSHTPSTLAPFARPALTSLINIFDLYTGTTT